jgi:hypothetical protein
MNEQLEVLEKAIAAGNQLLEQPDLLEKLRSDTALAAEAMMLSRRLSDLALDFVTVSAEADPIKF